MKLYIVNRLISCLGILASLGLVAAIAPVFAQTCYTDSQGNIVDLGTLCRTTEDRTAPAPQPQPIRGDSLTGFVHDAARTPFPAWLFDADLDNEDAYKTGQMSYVNSTLFIYQNRFIEQYRKWPYTASADNHAEWSYLDCRTGWRGLDNYPMVGSSEPFFIPPAQMDGATVEVYRGLCTTAGLQHRF